MSDDDRIQATAADTTLGGAAGAKLDESMIEEIRVLGTERAVNTGEILYRAGDDSPPFFVLLEGDVDIVQHARQGRGLELANLEVLRVENHIVRGRQDVAGIFQLDEALLLQQQQRARRSDLEERRRVRSVADRQPQEAAARQSAVSRGVHREMAGVVRARGAVGEDLRLGADREIPGGHRVAVDGDRRAVDLAVEAVDRERPRALGIETGSAGADAEAPRARQLDRAVERRRRALLRGVEAPAADRGLLERDAAGVEIDARLHPVPAKGIAGSGGNENSTCEAHNVSVSPAQDCGGSTGAVGSGEEGGIATSDLQ